MLRVVRAKVASTVAEISTAEDYSWQKWLKSPEIEKVFFPQPHRAHVQPKSPIKSFDEPELKIFLFPFTAPKIISSLGVLQYKDPTVSSLKFKILKQLNNKLNFEFVDTFGEFKDYSKRLKFITFTQLFAKTRIENSKLIFYEFNFSTPEIFDKLITLNPSIIRIELLDEKGNDFLQKIYSVKFVLDKKFQKYYGYNSMMSADITINSFTNYVIPTKSKILKFLPTINHTTFIKYNSINMNTPRINNPELSQLTAVPNYDKTIEMTEFLFKAPELINETILPEIINEYKEEIPFPIDESYPEVLSKRLFINKFLTDKYSTTVERIREEAHKTDVNSILLICGQNEFNRIGERKLIGSPEGWVENIRSIERHNLKILSDDLSSLNEFNTERINIYILSYETIANALIKNYIEDSKLNSFDVIILDEFQLELDKHFSLIRKISKGRNRFVWYISTGTKEYLVKEIQKVLPEEYTIKVQDVSAETKRNTQKLLRDHWLKLDKSQLIEYEETLKSAKKEMSAIAKEGNPFRFQSNIFTQIHKLKQACNFSFSNDQSSKAKLLVQHIQINNAAGKKLIVSSQYDGYGIKKIEQVLKDNSVGFITMKNNVSEIDYKKFLNGNLSVMLYNGRLSKLKLTAGQIPTIILFDNWWSPINDWHLENNLSTSFDGEIEIINYQMRDTIDESIYNKLMGKYLIDKNLFESLQSDHFSRLLTEDDWLEIIDVRNEFAFEKLKQDEMSLLTQDAFISLIDQFLRKLGLENINVEPGFDRMEFILKADYSSVSDKQIIYSVVFFDDFVPAERISNYIKEIRALSSPSTKIFLFCSGESELKNPLDDRCSIIDREKINSYKATFSLI